MANLRLVDPLPCLDFVQLMANARFNSLFGPEGHAASYDPTTDTLRPPCQHE